MVELDDQVTWWHITLNLAIKKIDVKSKKEEKEGKQQNQFRILLLRASDDETFITHS